MFGLDSKVRQAQLLQRLYYASLGVLAVAGLAEAVDGCYNKPLANCQDIPEKSTISLGLGETDATAVLNCGYFVLRLLGAYAPNNDPVGDVLPEQLCAAFANDLLHSHTLGNIDWRSTGVCAIPKS